MVLRFLVRNNSKYIACPEDTTGATHKWSVYLKLNDENLDISLIVSKVVFYLHPSYKPHNVVTISCPPFKITRRGWGEFDMRIKIFFTNGKDEPVDVVHPLVFDKFRSGLETFGGETILDHWISNEPTSQSIDSSPKVPENSRDIRENEFEEKHLANKNDKTFNVSKPSSPTTIKLSAFDSISTMPFTNETSENFLTAFFGESEELLNKKDSPDTKDCSENMQYTHDFSFPEFLNFEETKPAENKTENCKEGFLNDIDSLVENIESLVKNADNVMEDGSGLEFIEDLCRIQTPNPSSNKSDEPSNAVTECSEGNSEAGERDEEKSTYSFFENQESNNEEVFLSDLSEFGEEVVIADSNDVPLEKEYSVENSNILLSTLKNAEEPPGLDYSNLEMEDLIKFPHSDSVSTDTGQSSKVTAVSNSEIRNSFYIFTPTTSATNLTTISNPSVASTVRQISPKPVLATQNSIIQPTLLVGSPNCIPPISSNQDPNQKNTFRKCEYRKTPIISKQGTRKITRKNIVSSKVLSDKTSSLATNTLHPLFNVGLISTSSSIPSTVNTVTASKPVIINNVTPSITLVPMDSVNVPVSKTASIVLSSPKINKQVAPAHIVPSPLFVSNAAKSKVVKTLVSQNKCPPVKKENTLLVGSNSPKSKVTTSMSTVSNEYTRARSGSKQYLVKMPDGTMKSITLESLRPFNPQDSKHARPTQLIIQAPQSQVISKIGSSTASSQNTNVKAVTITGKRSNPTVIHVTPAKKQMVKITENIVNPGLSQTFDSKTKNLPIILPRTHQILFKIPRTPNTQPIVSLMNAQQVIRLPVPNAAKNHQPSIVIVKNKAQVAALSANSGIPSMTVNREVLDKRPEPQGTNNLERGPPETGEIVIPFNNEQTLVELCPRNSAETAIHWLMKKFPLVDARTKYRSFKIFMPYCAVSDQMFRQWPLAKQRAHELSRAGDVLNVVKKVMPCCEWTKLDIVRFARLRGFTPCSKNVDPTFKPDPPRVIIDHPTVADLEKYAKLSKKNEDTDEEIDVVTTVIEKRSKVKDPERIDRKGKVFMTLHPHLADAAMVEKWVEKVSIYLEPEEIVEGVVFPSVLRLLISAFHSFSEDLIRRTYSSGYIRYDFTEPHSLLAEDVRIALFSRPEFDLFTNAGLGIKYRRKRSETGEDKSLVSLESLINVQPPPR